MNNSRPNTLFRDLFILALLLVLISQAYKKAYSFLVMHKNSMIHELDRNFADQLYSAQRQARIVKNLLEQLDITDQRKTDFLQTNSQLIKIEDKYTKNSPGLLFLGPIGTASIILKEQELEKHLLDALNALGLLLLGLVDTNQKHTPALSIEAGLQYNQDLINKLLKIN